MKTISSIATRLFGPVLITSVLLGAGQAAATTSALYPTLSFAASILNQPLFPPSDAYTVDDDIVIYGSDGVNLEANILVPTTGAGPYPAVIFLNSWTFNEYQYLAAAARLAQKGYVVLSYTSRGWGSSGGLIETAGPEDVDDLSRVIDWLITEAPVDPERIGTAGMSYGAGIGLIGAAQDPRIKAVVALSGWGSLEDALYGQDTPRLMWGEMLTTSAELQGRPAPEMLEHWQNIRDNTGLDEAGSWLRQRSPLTYVDQLNAHGTAVYQANSYGDNLFQPNSPLELHRRLTGPKHMDLQPGTHISAETIGMLGDGNTHIWNNVHRWFDSHLKGETTEIDTLPPLQMKVLLTDRYEGFDDFPVPDADQKRWYLHPRNWLGRGGLSDQPWSGRPLSHTISAWADTLAGSGIPVASQVLEQIELPVTAPLKLLGQDRSIWFQTAPLQDRLAIRGNPEVSLRITPRHNRAQLVAYLYDMDWSGTGRLISHAPVTLRSVEPGQSRTVEIEMVTTAYDVPAGHRLVLAVDTRDLLYQHPPGSATRVSFEFDGAHPSSLVIPALAD